MSAVTYFVVQPFRPAKPSRKGRAGLVPAEALEARSQSEALRAARNCADRGGAGLAFSRRGDPVTGDFDDAVILGVFGPVPEQHLD
jgi:hypothetical protein